MDCDDWIDSDANDDHVLMRNAEKEQDNARRRIHDQGYLEGLEWADDNYLKLDGDLSIKSYFEAGVKLGVSSSEQRIRKFTAVGQLNVLMLTGCPKAKEILTRLDKVDTDSGIG